MYLSRFNSPGKRSFLPIVDGAKISHVLDRRKNHSVLVTTPIRYAKFRMHEAIKLFGVVTSCHFLQSDLPPPVAVCGY